VLNRCNSSYKPMIGEVQSVGLCSTSDGGVSVECVASCVGMHVALLD